MPIAGIAVYLKKHDWQLSLTIAVTWPFWAFMGYWLGMLWLIFAGPQWVVTRFQNK